jgi:hypothetical protein
MRCIYFLLAVIAGLFLIPATITPMAAAHDWYPIECCQEHDCRRVTYGVDVRETPQGYLTLTGLRQLLPYSDPRVRVSPDGAYHLCRHIPWATDHRGNRLQGPPIIDVDKSWRKAPVICIFVPPPSM